MFVFKKGMFTDVPPFAIGRGVWARWFIYAALRQDAPVIDVSDALITIHQNHDYPYVSSSKAEDRGWHRIKTSEEYLENARLAGIAAYFSDKDVNYKLGKQGLKPNTSLIYEARRLAKPPLLNPSLRPLLQALTPPCLP